jgi:hypothetical protein
MLTTQVALVPLEKLHEPPGDDYRELLRVAAALQTQIARDFGPIWGVSSVVTPFLCLEDVPPQYLPVILHPEPLPRGEHGFHLAADGRPFALVHLDADWSVTASHELMEMVLDPAGVLTVSAPSLRDVYYEIMGEDPWPGASGDAADRTFKPQGAVDYLVEPCDPVEDARTYTIDGVTVSDFVTPCYYDSFGPTGRRYSFLDTIKAPFEICDGGYLSWRTHDPQNSVWQAHAAAPDRPPAEPPKPVCGTMSDHLQIGRLKDQDSKPPRQPGTPEDDFVSRFSRDQVSVRMRRGRRNGGATATSEAQVPAGSAAGSPASGGEYGARFREDVETIVGFLAGPPPPTLRDIIHLLEEIKSAAKDANSKPAPATAEQLRRYGIPDTDMIRAGTREDLDSVITLLKKQEKISNILDSNASDPDLARWLCYLMP